MTISALSTESVCVCVCVCLFYLVDVAQPFADVFEALGIGDVVDQHDAHGSSVVGGGDGVEPFLARCVPTNTHTHRFHLFVFAVFLYWSQPKQQVVLWVRLSLHHSTKIWSQRVWQRCWSTPVTQQLLLHKMLRFLTFHDHNTYQQQMLKC